MNQGEMPAGRQGGLDMLFYDYRGYTIYPVPSRFGTAGSWRIMLMVRSAATTRTYCNDEEYETEGEAVFNCIKFGKRAIDEGVDGAEGTAGTVDVKRAP
jgi:hypothetical protein